MLAGTLPMAALLLTASNRQRPGGKLPLAPTVSSERGLAFVIPDVAWYDSTAIGWAGTDPDTTIGLGHGAWEQVYFMRPTGLLCGSGIGVYLLMNLSGFPSPLYVDVQAVLLTDGLAVFRRWIHQFSLLVRLVPQPAHDASHSQWISFP